MEVFRILFKKQKVMYPWKVLYVGLISLFGICIISFCSERKEKKNIVVVNVGDFDREIIARGISIVDSLNPKVIALDLQFLDKQGTRKDSILRKTLNSCGNLIMASEIADFKGEDVIYEKLTGTLPEFISNHKTGFVNVILENDDVKTLKKFSIQERVNRTVEFHFAIRTAMSFDSLKTINFIKKNEKIVTVDYRDPDEIVTVFGVSDVLERNITTKDIKNKIVLFGSFSAYQGDVFFSPLNSYNYKIPDMFGVIFHANVIAQVLRDSD